MLYVHLKIEHTIIYSIGKFNDFFNDSNYLYLKCNDSYFSLEKTRAI